jgi:hypothetical protein
MTLPAPPSGLYPEDYDRIEAAVMETVRGRWFLLEFARRQRAVETERLVHAVDRLERYVASRVETLEAPREASSEEEPAGEWRLPYRLAERAREFASTVRASGLSEELCARADALAEELAAFAEAAAAEARPDVAAAALVEPEIVEEPEVSAADEPVDAGAEAEEPIIEAEAEAVDEADAFAAPQIEDAEFAEIETSPLEAEAEIEEAPLAPVDPRLMALSRLQHLTMREKLRLFG